MKVMSKIKEIFNRVWPGYVFWANFLEKLFSFAVSFKVWVVALASVFRVLNYINGETWATAVVSITLGRVIVQGVTAAKQSQTTETTTKLEVTQEQLDKILGEKPDGE